MEQMKQPLFSLGQVVATPGALDKTHPVWMANCLARHTRGDWGSVSEEDVETNNAGVGEGGRLLSAYPIDETKPCKGYGDNTLWIITEWDRSVTTFLLPNEY